MRAFLYVNGWRVGEIDYELPRRDGRAIPTPGDHDGNEVVVAIVANTDDNESPAWVGRAKLERYTVARAVPPSSIPPSEKK